MNRKRIINIIPYLLAMLVFMSLLNFSNTSNSTRFAANTFMNQAENMEFKDVNISIGSVKLDVSGIYVENGQEIMFSTSIPATQANQDWLMEVLDEGNNSVVVSDPNQSNYWMEVLVSTLPLLLLAGATIFLFTKMNSGGNKQAFLSTTNYNKDLSVPNGVIRVKDFDDLAKRLENKSISLE